MNKNVAKIINRVNYFTIKCPQAAAKLSNILIRSPNDSIILPFTDHPGPLSREILSRDFGSLTVCERDRKMAEQFRLHCRENFSSKRIHVYHEDLFNLSYRAHSDVAQKICSDIVLESLSRDSLGPGNSGVVKFLVPLLQSRYEAGFLKNLYYQMSLKIGLCSNTLVHYYFLMSDRQFNYLNAKPGGNLNHFRANTILYNTMFDIKRLASFELEPCFKIDLKKIQKTAKVNSSSYKKVHVIWLEPRPEIMTKLDSRSLLEYRFFVNQLMFRRTRLVMPVVEGWFENCRHDIENLNITESTRSGDLDREQYFKLFCYIKKRSDYNRSTFLQAVECAEENLSV